VAIVSLMIVMSNRMATNLIGVVKDENFTTPIAAPISIDPRYIICKG
jgi:hypothetical protein